jgi:4,5-DOPA dioxygenase extradiol
MNKTRMPVLFIGHGSPMNAVEDNEFSRSWKTIAALMPKPRAILCISAHWETRGTYVTAMPAPPTIHDFGGFPRELFEMEYPAPGSQDLVDRVAEIVKSTGVQSGYSWGLDHGTWSVLHPMYPQADIPVVQLSLDRSSDFDFHYQLGKELKTLRDAGVLILGSGNMVHNLRTAVFNDSPFDWAIDYDGKLRDWILKGDHESIIHYERHGKAAELSVNSGEHYLPLLVVLGAAESEDPIQFFCETVSWGSLSMRCVQYG